MQGIILYFLINCRGLTLETFVRKKKQDGQNLQFNEVSIHT